MTRQVMPLTGGMQSVDITSPNQFSLPGKPSQVGIKKSTCYQLLPLNGRSQKPSQAELSQDE